MQDVLRLLVLLAAAFTLWGVAMVTTLHFLTRWVARWKARRQARRWPALARMSDEQWLASLAPAPPAFEPPIFEAEFVEQPTLFDQDATAVLDVTSVFDQDAEEAV